MTQVPTYDEFLALAKEVQELQREVALLRGIGGGWLDRKQAIKALNCSESTFHRLKREGKLPHRYEGSKPLFNADGLRAYIESTCVSADAATERVIAARQSKAHLKCDT